MVRTANAPVFFWKGDSFWNNAQEVDPWSRVTHLGAVKTASTLILKTGSAARRVRMAAGSGQITDPGGAMMIMRLLNDYSAPDAADSVFQKVARL